MPYERMKPIYDRAVGKQPQASQLGWSFLDWDDNFKKPVPLAKTPSSYQYFNAGVNMAYGRSSAYPSRSGGDTGLKPRGYRKRGTSQWSLFGRPDVDVGVEAYNRSQAYMDYGNAEGAQHELGDLFNDIVGAIVPGWDQRPAALKSIVLKPDMDKVMQTAQRVAPGAARQIVEAANANGMNVYVNTPGGQITVTPDNADFYYKNYAFLTRTQGVLTGAYDAVSAMSPMTWLAIGGIGLGLFLMMKR